MFLIGVMKFVLPFENREVFSALIAMISVLPFYVLFSKYLIQRDSDEAVEKGEFIGKRILLLLALQIFVVVTGCAIVFL